MKFDFVGDIHGHAQPFVTLLQKLGYSPVDGVWQHPERILVSVGDIIDRGPEQKQVVDILMAMQQHNKAIVIMGNHEFYAIAWHMNDSKGNPLRPHTPKNYEEHKAFLEQVGNDTEWLNKTIEWFKTLPVFIDTPEYRCVHAAWHDDHINTLKSYTNSDGVLPATFWQNIENTPMSFFKALNYILNGSKVTLPEGYTFVDSGGHKRNKARLKWWDVPSTDATYRNSCTSVPNLSELPDHALALENKPKIEQAVPIFFGHYWMQGQPILMTPQRACLDWSVVVEEGVLAAYRFDGEQTLTNNKLVWV
ncbi:MAG: metallophosphoesterase [Glaciecola sp.]